MAAERFRRPFINRERGVGEGRIAGFVGGTGSCRSGCGRVAGRKRRVCRSGVRRCGCLGKRGLHGGGDALLVQCREAEVLRITRQRERVLAQRRENAGVQGAARCTMRERDAGAEQGELRRSGALPVTRQRHVLLVQRREAEDVRGAAEGNGEVGVPAVSMARRRVDRLRAANIAAAPWKFARKLARPPDCVRNTRQKIGDFRPY